MFSCLKRIFKNRTFSLFYGLFLYSLLDDIYIDAPDVYSLADEVKKIKKIFKCTCHTLAHDKKRLANQNFVTYFSYTDHNKQKFKL
ncbi:hypothetical protein DF947_21665 [Pedobacter paludis]|uniref:Uncharacterized protein n=1 Tax=Pedobacter paludis TaxID=2203212 RepID=A0A317EWQ5_9SPHI|nr:hypothetical protein DF947_21665 [Pedobacter paludis]